MPIVTETIISNAYIVPIEAVSEIPVRIQPQDRVISPYPSFGKDSNFRIF